MSVTAWRKIGKPKIIAQEFVHTVYLQGFEDPVNKKVTKFFQIDSIPFCCIVMPITKDNQVLAIRQFRRAANKVLLELPGGIPDNPDQSPKEVAENELIQETGYKNEILIQLTSNPIWSEPTILTSPFYPFLALGCQPDEGQKLDNGEYIELIKIPLSQWFNHCLNGNIVDCKALATTLLAQNILTKKGILKL